MGGAAKALLKLEDRTFLEQIVETARRGGAEGIGIVLGHHASVILPSAQTLCDRVATNHDPDRGMTSSARALSRIIPTGASMLLWPIDHPAVRLSTIMSLLEAGAAAPLHLISPVHDGRPGHPPLLPPSLVEALRSIDDGQRLDRFLLERSGPPKLVEVEDPGVLRDVDRPQDLATLKPQPS